jgi:hypothetical protein
MATKQPAGAAQPEQVRSPDAPAFVAVAGDAPHRRAQALEYGTVGWAGDINVVPEWQQNGRYGQPVQSQINANLPGFQLRCGVEDMRKSWYDPARGPLPNWQRTQVRSNVPGPQLWGSAFSGHLGGMQSGAISNGVAARAAAGAGGQANVVMAEHLAQSGAY